jgi:asparagine synthase (glutamine-hydrolysing)
MCGIFGHLNTERAPRVCHQALGRIAHRGPDDEGHWHSGQLCLGMRRLSIIDLSGGGQPIWNEDGTCGIVYNGELYNFLDLRPELEARGHTFRTRSDTEVVLHAYEEWGPGCLRHLNGMFAFAIWNTRDRVLFVARDRVGEKPLYYYHDARRLVFASEIKAILADDTVPRELNLRGLANFLAFSHAIAPETIYRNIYKLLPGHYLVTDPGSVQFRTVQYWDVGTEPPAPTVSSEEAFAEQIRSLLDDSVRRRMIADVPVGAFLSGGIDSSAVVAFMQRHANRPVKTFSLGFSDGTNYDELPDAKRVAQYVGTEHHELVVDHADLVKALPTLVYHYDEPFGDAAGFAVYMLSAFAREHVKVVLTGDGGDELFGGYVRYALDQMAGVYSRLPRLVTRTAVPALFMRIPQLRRLVHIARTLSIRDPGERYASWLAYFTPDLRAALWSAPSARGLATHDPAHVLRGYYAGLSPDTAGGHLNRLMYVDLKTLLVDGYLEKTDKATMACSLEARLPLLDHRLIELAFQIPGRHKVRGRSTKRILKRALADVLPAAVLQKPKRGFGVPTESWFRGHLKAFAFDVLLDSRARRRGYFNADAIERLWRQHADGHRFDGQLWLLLNFELWHRVYLDREPV